MPHSEPPPTLRSLSQSEVLAIEISRDDSETAARCAYLGAALIAQANILAAEIRRAHQSGETVAVRYVGALANALESRLEQRRQLSGFKPASTYTTSHCLVVDEAPPPSKRAA